LRHSIVAYLIPHFQSLKCNIAEKNPSVIRFDLWKPCYRVTGVFAIGKQLFSGLDAAWLRLRNACFLMRAQKQSCLYICKFIVRHFGEIVENYKQ